MKKTTIVLSILMAFMMFFITSCAQEKTQSSNKNPLDEKYEAAINLMESGKYSEAITAFKGLDGYKDSNQKIEDCEKNKFKEGLKNIKVGDIIKLGKYEQNNVLSDGKEDIEWNVLAIENGKALVISKYILDSYKWEVNINKGFAFNPVRWNKSMVRNFLNNDFLNVAFSQEEIGVIQTSSIKSVDYEEIEDNLSSDKIFILSYNEINLYLTTKSLRNCGATAFAKANGQNNEYWYVRGSAYYTITGYTMNHYDPKTDTVEGADYNYTKCGVRPAMWINLS